MMQKFALLIKRFVRSIRLNALFQGAIVATALVLGLCLNPAPAMAWKPTTHVYLGEQARNDALDGKVTINRLNPATGEIVGTIGEFPVDPTILAAIRDFPSQYRAGILGPDAYPDILTGQQVIHPPTNPDGSNRWLEYLWTNSNQSPAIKAFVVGYLTHAAGDMYGHTFINNFTGAPFTLTPPDNAIKHILAEGYVDKRAPSPTFDVSIQGVDDFIYRNLVDARPGTYLDQALLRQGGEGTTYSVPRIYSTLRANLQRDIDGYYAAKAGYDRRRDDLLRAAKNCRWNDFSCSARKLEIQAAAVLAEKGVYMAANALPTTYKEYWRADIDSGLRAWVNTSHEVAKALFFNPEKKADVDRAQTLLNNYVNEHLISMSGFPDVAGDLRAIAGKVIDQITPTFLKAPIEQLKNNIYDAVIVRATGMTKEQLKNYFSNPALYFDDVMTKGSGQSVNLNTFNTQYLRLNGSDPNEKFDYQKVAPAYNTVTMSKLLLLGTDGVKQLLTALNDPSPITKPNAMLGFINTLDGSNEQRKMVLAQCPTYRQVFMKQAGEAFCQ